MEKAIEEGIKFLRDGLNIGAMYANRSIQRDFDRRNYWQEFDPRHENVNDRILLFVELAIIVILVLAIIKKK